jgi:hypothetical protein
MSSIANNVNAGTLNQGFTPQGVPQQPQQPVYPQQPYVQQPVFGTPYGGQAMYSGQPNIYYMNQPEKVQYTNGLDPKIMQELIKRGRRENLQITEDDMYKAHCTHRDQNRLRFHSTNNPDKPAEVECEICGAVWNLLEDITLEDVKSACTDFHDLLHTMKVLNVDIAPKLCREIFQILPIVDKTPDLYKISADRFNRYANPNGIGGQSNGQYFNGMAAWNSIVGGQPYQQPMMQQPQMMQPMYPQYPQQPMAPMQGYGQMQPPINQQAMQMTANAPGMQSNGFGVTQPPINVEPTAQQPGQTGVPTVTKQLQA